jgi:hypothetical protein
LQRAELALLAENRLQRQRAAAGRVEGARADFAGNRDGLKGENGEWREKEKVFLEINQLNSNLNLNSSNHKQCSSMNAITHQATNLIWKN